MKTPETLENILRFRESFGFYNLNSCIFKSYLIYGSCLSVSLLQREESHRQISGEGNR